MMKQRIEINVPLGYVAEVVHNTKYPELSTHIENEADNVWKEIILKKAPYYDELQKLLAEGYEDIGTDETSKEGDLFIRSACIRQVPAGLIGGIPCCWLKPPAAILRKKLTGAAWLKAQKDGTMFYFDGTEYIIWRGRAINLSCVPLFFNDMAGCSDETCRIIERDE